MDLLIFMKLLASFTLPIVGYLILFSGKRKKSGHYSQPGWNFALKKMLAKYTVKRWKKQQLPALEMRVEEELPRDLEAKSWDSLAFKATAPDGTLLHLSISLHHDKLAELVVQVALPGGEFYRLPHPTETGGTGPLVTVPDEAQWCAGGLKFTVLNPFEHWRILYNGLLVDGSGRLQHVRLNLVWAAASAPLRHPQDWSDELAARALATERWRDGGWQDVLESCSSSSGWEQWGSVQGLVRVDDSPEVVLRARGVRERWRSSASAPSLRRAVTLLAAARDGTAVYLRAHSYNEPGLPTQAISGTIRNSNCAVESISSTDFSMAQFCETRSDIPPSYIINIGGSKQCVVFLDTKSCRTQRQTLANGRLCGLETISVPVKIIINGDPGYGLLELGYAQDSKEHPQESTPGETVAARCLRWTALEGVPAAERRHCCAHFPRAAASCPQLVGAKGASLALLSSIHTDEYSVPPGFCLTTHALERHVAQHPHLRSAIQDIIKVNEKYDEAHLKEKCTKAVQLFSETRVGGDVRQEILTHLAELKQAVVEQKLVDEVTFAVRSSAIGEDSEELSAAGQNDTVLGCRDDEQVLRGVERCWASLYSFHSTQYRRMHGQVANSGMGVVVQVVIPARAAGVLFSRHPNTGHPARILLTANYGLGESVVSGQVEPDTIVLERLSNDDVKILTVEVGKKSHRVVLSREGSTEEIALTGDESGKSCLTERECLMLGRLAVKQEELWQAPRDLEWAIYKDKLYLVQARPITSLERWTEYELLHELDTPVMSEDELFSFANTGEVLPGALTPLTTTTVADALKRSIYYVALGGRPGSFMVPDPFFLSHYHCGFNLYNTIYAKTSKQIDVGVRVVEMAVHGHEVADERIHAVALKRHPPRPIANLMSALYFTFQLFFTSTRLKEAKRLVNDFIIDAVQFEDPRDMISEIENSAGLMTDVFVTHSQTTTSSVYSQVVAMSILLEGDTKFSMDHCADIGLMLSSCKDIVSADVPIALEAIAEGINAIGRHEEFCSLPASECLTWLQHNAPDVHQKLCKFLKDQAHRNIKEFDLATKTWGLDSTSLLQSIQATVKARSEQTQRLETKTVMSNKEISQSLVSPKSAITRRLLRLMLPLCQRTVSHREATKAQLIIAVHKLRLACLKLGRLMVRDWMLPNEDLVFYFTLRELKTYIHSRDPALIRKATQRCQYYPSWNALKFPEINEGHLEPLRTLDPRLQRAGTGARLRGTPVCPGEVIARACVITDLAQISQLQRGDILITHSTDIGWSPYFPLLGGVVTELGGLISHGAVIAREYGLPCIVGASGATDFCRTGDVVLLASGAGVLEKIDPVDGNINNAL